jgi:hypothetical protein
MKMIGRGVLNRGEPGSRRAITTYPTVTALADGTLLASYKVGSAKECEDGTIELRHSDDGGRSWSQPVTPFETTLDGVRGSLAAAYLTPIADNHYELGAAESDSAEGAGHTGDVLTEMSMWNFGMPFATALPDGDVMVVFYEGTLESMQASWVRLSL